MSHLRTVNSDIQESIARIERKRAEEARIARLGAEEAARQAKMTAAELASAAKPLIGCSFTILCPSVLMIRQPPAAVPAAMVIAQTTFTQTGISKPWSCAVSIRKNPSQSGNPADKVSGDVHGIWLPRKLF